MSSESESSNNTTPITASVSPTPLQSSTSSSQSYFEPTWQLPTGIENHIEAFLLKSALGIAVGGTVGFLAFRSGRGSNAVAGMAFGVGCALGSFVQRGILGGEGVDPAVPKLDTRMFSSWTAGKNE